jgi:hypothetical protein
MGTTHYVAGSTDIRHGISGNFAHPAWKTNLFSSNGPHLPQVSCLGVEFWKSGADYAGGSFTFRLSGIYRSNPTTPYCELHFYLGDFVWNSDNYLFG